MSKLVNKAMIDGLAKELDGVDSCVVVGPRSLTVEEMEGFRNRLRENDFRMRWVKNSLARVALAKTDIKGVEAVLDGASALVFGGEGALAISRVVVKEAETLKEKLVVHGGFFEGEVVDPKGVDALSKAPNRKEALGMVLSGFFGPVDELQRSFGGLLSEMQGLIEALSKEKGAE